MSNELADSAGTNWNIRSVKQLANSFVPINMVASRFMARYSKRPADAVLTYSESSIVFRDEPWVLWIEVATQVAGFSDRSLRRFKKVVERALGSPNCRAIMCHSEAARKSLQRHLHTEAFESKLRVTLPGWPVTAHEPLAKAASQPVRILFVAGNTMASRFKIKGGVESLEAFAALRQRFPNLELIVRSDVEPEIRRRYEGMPGLRIVPGLIPYQELAELYRESDIYWYPAHCLTGMGLAEPDRAEVVAWGLAECGTILLLFLSVSLERLKAEKVFSARSRSDRFVFQLLAVWFGACVVSALVGIARGNQWDYILGDFYRFGSLSIVFGLIYFSVKSHAEAHKLLRGFVAVYGLMVVLDLVRFNSFIREEQERLTTETAHQAGMLAAAVIYLMLFDQKSWVRKASVVILLLMMVLLLRAQMLTPLITSLLAMVLFFSFSRKIAVFVGGAVAALILVAASFYSVSVTPTVPTYIADKLLLAEGSQGSLESLEALSGVRLGEIISIGEEFANHPASLPFGTGQGSLVSPDPILDPALATARYTLDKHYVHSGLFDALYHNGAIAVGAFLLLVWNLFRRGRCMYQAGNPFGQFVMVNLIVTIVLLGYDLPFESALPLLAVCFSGVSTMESRHGLGLGAVGAGAPRLRVGKNNRNLACDAADVSAS